MTRTAPAKTAPATEPVLELGDIQGNVMPGFATGFQTLLLVRIEDPAAARPWLAGLAPAVTSAAELLDHLRGPGRDASASRPRLNVAFTYEGLRKLAPDTESIMDMPFKEGMHRRSRLLGDPVEPESDGNVENWLVGGPGNLPDVLLIFGGDDHGDLSAAVARFVAELPAGLVPVHRDDGARLTGVHGAHEHFGFRDPISQPGVRGRVSADAGDLLTPRLNPDNPDQGKPGQNLIWPGEFVFGYPGQDPMDLTRPGTVARLGPHWTRNGSLLVYRRLRQDVAEFRTFLAEAAATLARDRGLELTPDQLAARLVGRWPSGLPILRSPDRDRPGLASDERALDEFRFVDGVPGADGDPLGLVCPPAAHVRKAYPRDHATSLDTVTSMETHRVLRRGVPYGPPYPAAGERGLLFLAYQTSFERQFEFITRAWLNNPNLRSGTDGHDPVVGQTSYAIGGDRSRKFLLPYRNREGAVDRVHIRIPRDWVVPTGGGYFFTPAIGALRHLAGVSRNGGSLT